MLLPHNNPNLKRHFSTSNISTKAIFSILSGLYDLFTKEAFGLRPDICIPSLLTFLGKNYERFLVTPSPIQWYFPLEFMKKSGLKEIYSFENLKFPVKEEHNPLGRYIGRDEIETFNLFLERVGKSKEPFLGIYLSFTAHFPYFDYGPKYQIIENDGRLISRYYNNLNLLDDLIKNLYIYLNNNGLLERTIILIVGDHGQAFGQHQKDNYMHHRYSYNENMETPVIIYQPRLFKPKIFSFPTSHVDILPTILDVLEIPYNPDSLNGDSLLNSSTDKRYIFFYGQEGIASCVDPNLIKIQYSFKNKRCWVFDLKNDPEEKNPLDCSSFKYQYELLYNFISNHNSKLIQYNISNCEK